MTSPVTPLKLVLLMQPSSYQSPLAQPTWKKKIKRREKIKKKKGECGWEISGTGIYEMFQVLKVDRRMC